SGEKYYVVLLDGPDADVASVVHSFGPTELREAAKQPGFEVSSVSEKITIKFNTKMKNSALDVENYVVYDNGGKELGDLSEFVEDGDGTWVNAIEKREIEFTLDSDADKNLLAGKTYKIRLAAD